jgi:hypothetical protein
LGDQRKQKLDLEKQSTVKTLATEKKSMKKTITKKGTSYLTVNAQMSMKSSVIANDPLFDSMASKDPI